MTNKKPNQNTELEEYTNIRKQIQQSKKRTQANAPLSNKLREELHQQKDSKLGELRIQINNLKTIKKQEFRKANNFEEEIKKRTAEIYEITEEYNEQIHLVDEQLKNLHRDIELLAEHQERVYEELPNTDLVRPSKPNLQRTLDKDRYGNGDTLRRIQGIEKNLRQAAIGVREEELLEDLQDKRFEEQYGEGFNQAKQRINELEDLYDEAILFGDLNIVHQVYNELKAADRFLETLAEIQIT